eukprot:TRINITY_DN14638_c0_g1_i1.p1 TRINITY_DN14638_c0_g1~~TRINITY_DN14638_c0_g1_i1.p1  ORF type:complete len:282 (+),score=66.69 TRINITY_DN14638_c0_g1_i1:173-1018(+)
MELIKTLAGSNEKEFAAQLSLFEWKLFRNISIKEFLEYSRNGLEKSPSIQSSILWFNNLSNSIITDILKPDIKQRARALRFWIKVAEECKKLNNFNSFFSVLGSLGSCSICRLRRTWETLSKKNLDLYHELETVVSSADNFKEYRSLLERTLASRAPCVPYLGIYLRDITFIDENPSTLENGKANQFRIDLERHVIANVIAFQDREFKTSDMPHLRMILESWKKSNANTNLENGLYERSVLMEPARGSHEDLGMGRADISAESAACAAEVPVKVPMELREA